MRAEPKTLLFALVGAVPLLVGGAVTAAVLLQRAGLGIAVWGLLPLLGLLGAVLVLAVMLGRAADDERRSSERKSSERKSNGSGRSDGEDGV